MHKCLLKSLLLVAGALCIAPDLYDYQESTHSYMSVFPLQLCKVGEVLHGFGQG